MKKVLLLITSLLVLVGCQQSKEFGKTEEDVGITDVKQEGNKKEEQSVGESYTIDEVIEDDEGYHYTIRSDDKGGKGFYWKLKALVSKETGQSTINIDKIENGESIKKNSEDFKNSIHEVEAYIQENPAELNLISKYKDVEGIENIQDMVDILTNEIELINENDNSIKYGGPEDIVDKLG